ncbi:hypothetical protein Xlen_03900 [Xanthomonas campestris pv. leeana]|nr:hypothetical protein Xths_06015 [Xanthomonas campestris pv. thespesiae]OOW76868.1 hypothetical protein Xlen_03900 [Xanthomonas campestris pv. leeana]
MIERIFVRDHWEMVTLLLFKEFGIMIPTVEMVRDPDCLEAKADKDRWEAAMTLAGKGELIWPIYQRLNEVRFLPDEKLIALLRDGTARTPDTSSSSSQDRQYEKKLGTRERSNLIAVIAALLKLSKLNGKGDPAVVEAMVEKLGFEGPAEETIRKVLKTAKADSPNWDSTTPS